MLTEPTAEGIALRVDPNLRPEGRSGPLSRSLPSMGEYYARHAATWERQALLKARPVAGDPALGSRFLEVVEPLVYPEVLPPSAIEDVRSSKARIEDHVRTLLQLWQASLLRAGAESANESTPVNRAYLPEALQARGFVASGYAV